MQSGDVKEMARGRQTGREQESCEHDGSVWLANGDGEKSRGGVREGTSAGDESWEVCRQMQESGSVR